MILDSKISFDEHLKSALSKTSEAIGLLRKFQGILPRSCLLTIFKSFGRRHIGYEDVIYTTRYSMNPSIKGLNLYSIMQQLQ